MSPNYYSTVFGSSYPIIANMLYWLWFINFNLGIFNALPIGPLDGGQLYGALIESRSRFNKARLKNISTVVSWIMVLIVVVGFVIPYLPF
jgi:membrane-associated protease RseP (regulator of RpoE activity)